MNCYTNLASTCLQRMNNHSVNWTDESGRHLKSSTWPSPSQCDRYAATPILTPQTVAHRRGIISFFMKWRGRQDLNCLKKLARY